MSYVIYVHMHAPYICTYEYMNTAYIHTYVLYVVCTYACCIHVYMHTYELHTYVNTNIGKYRWSFTKMINRSIVEASGLGSTLFTICIIDLQPIGSSNRITKYADDFCLMVPETYDVDMLDEFQHVLNWAGTNKLTINMCTTKELVLS